MSKKVYTPFFVILGKKRTGAIVGGVLGAAAVLLLVLGAAIFIVYRLSQDATPYVKMGGGVDPADSQGVVNPLYANSIEMNNAIYNSDA